MGTPMLVLRRRVGEAIAIGPDVEIEVIEISRSRVKLGVRAPRSVPVMRRETIRVAIENRDAAALLEGPRPPELEQFLHSIRAKGSSPDADKLSSGYSGHPE